MVAGGPLIIILLLQLFLFAFIAFLHLVECVCLESLLWAMQLGLLWLMVLVPAISCLEQKPCIFSNR